MNMEKVMQYTWYSQTESCHPLKFTVVATSETEARDHLWALFAQIEAIQPTLRTVDQQCLEKRERIDAQKKMVSKFIDVYTRDNDKEHVEKAVATYDALSKEYTDTFHERYKVLDQLEVNENLGPYTMRIEQYRLSTPVRVHGKKDATIRDLIESTPDVEPFKPVTIFSALDG